MQATPVGMMKVYSSLSQQIGCPCALLYCGLPGSFAEVCFMAAQMSWDGAENSHPH